MAATYFHDKQAAKIAELSPETFRGVRFRGLKPQGPGLLWSARQVLGVAVKSQALRVGASRVASTRACQILCSAKMPELRQAIADGRQYMRLLGDVADPNLVSHAAAFHPETMRTATEHRIPYVVVDLGYWLDRIDQAAEGLQDRKAVAVL